jgi:hypothetical protein
MHAEYGRLLRRGALAVHSFQRHQRLERRIVVHKVRLALISSSLETSRLLIEVSLTVRFPKVSSVTH